MIKHTVTLGIAYDSPGGVWETMDVTVQGDEHAEVEQIEEWAKNLAYEKFRERPNRHLHVAHIWIHHFNEAESEEIED